MDVLFFNIPWMAFNLYLALLPVLFCGFLFRMPNKFYTVVLGIFWLLYLPNTIYILTDLHHLVQQWNAVSVLEKFLLLIQYGLLELIGLTCFLIAFFPLEKILRKFKISQHTSMVLLIGLNFLMGFAMVLGKIERVNSWDLFVNPQFVIDSAIHLLRSFQLVSLGILFGLFANFFYFLFREKIKWLYTQWSTG
ncbi:MAG TPA: DUF1361 domain-containing protein [Methylomirabilota bacterium]|nr:DUF1361 domain-containing protein [Methylomirabilota bacterium]